MLTLTVPTLSDPSLAPPGEHLVVLTTLLAQDARIDWRRRKVVGGQEDMIIDVAVELERKAAEAQAAGG